MIKYILHILICLTVSPALSQDAKEDMRKMNASYLKHTDLSMGITYRVFANYKDETPIETSTGSYYQQGSNRYNRLNEIESVQNNECSLVIDNEEKVIVIGNPVKVNAGKMGIMDLDTAFANYSSVKYITGNEFQK